MLETLNRDTILETVKSIPNGRFTRVTYKTELPLKAEFKKQGYHIIKITETTGRFGVNYHNIATVIARKAERALEESVSRNYTNHYEWVIENKVKHNNKTGKDYLVLANFNGGQHTKSQYKVVIDSSELFDLTATLNEKDFMDTYKDMIINSYWKPSTTGGEVKTIAFDNVIRIGEVGEKVEF